MKKGKNQRRISIALPNPIITKEKLEIIGKLDASAEVGCSLGAFMGRIPPTAASFFLQTQHSLQSIHTTVQLPH